jgi:hypothetical protein
MEAPRRRMVGERAQHVAYRFTNNRRCLDTPQGEHEAGQRWCVPLRRVRQVTPPRLASNRHECSLVHRVHEQSRTGRIEPDPVRAPHIVRLFEWYGTGELSLSAVTAGARAAGLDHRKSRNPLTKSEVHRLLRDPIYMGEFDSNAQRYASLHEPVVSREVWDRTRQCSPAAIDQRTASTRLPILAC